MTTTTKTETASARRVLILLGLPRRLVVVVALAVEATRVRTNAPATVSMFGAKVLIQLRHTLFPRVCQRSTMSTSAHGSPPRVVGRTERHDDSGESTISLSLVKRGCKPSLVCAWCLRAWDSPNLVGAGVLPINRGAGQQCDICLCAKAKC